MARRDPRSKLANRPDRRPASPSASTSTATALEPEGWQEPDPAFASIGEFLRKAALGLAAMLLVIRAYFPSEDAETGSGLVWVFAVLATTAIGLASALFAGSLKVRWSWADAAMLVLMFLVAMSASHAADRRPAITMAWEWGALGLLYFLVRNLPRSRGESATLAGSMVATAVAVSAYGIYQLPVEFAKLRNLFTKHPEMVLARMGYEPNTPQAEALRQRLFSNDVFSTFALPNSLAGFLVGPLALCFAIALENLARDRDRKGSKLVAFLMALVPGLMVMICLVLTRSRSAWIGLFVAILVLAWRARKALPAKVLAASGLALAILVGGLVAGGVATKQLDRQVITQATLSLRYRWEYWVGAWGVITNAPSPYAATGETPLPGSGEVEASVPAINPFWWGVGPSNFATPYLRHKLPQASEEVQDPHNMLLEVWTCSGLWALLALVAALVIGLRETLGPARSTVDETPEPVKPSTGKPSGLGWLLVMAGLGWIGVWAFGKLNPLIDGDLLNRWLILGLAWGLAVALGSAFWKLRPIPAAGLGVGVLALAINLLAAGGIGIPSVAMVLWVMLAIGLNLREDRSCGQLREFPSLLPTIGLACIWAALAGTYFGAITPFWHSESERAIGDDAMSLKPPAFEVARKAYLEAIDADRYNVRPFLGLANLEYAYWRSPEGSSRKEPIWPRVTMVLSTALNGPGRSPDNLNIRRLQARYARAILHDLPEKANVAEILELKSTIVRACRKISQVYPTSATARADLAQASADIGLYPDAAREAKQALVLDGLTPHRDKKLPDALRTQLERDLKVWEKKASEPPPPIPPAGSASGKK